MKKIILTITCLISLLSFMSCPTQINEQDIFKVTYDISGATQGLAPIDNKNYLKNDTVTVLGIGDITKQGYSFIYWNTKQDGSGISYNQDSNFTITNNITLYAIWVQEYTITYDSNNATSGSAPIDSNKYQNAQNTTILDNINLVKNGYIFIGWNTKPDGSGTNYTKGYEYTFSNSNLVLYANWEQNTEEYTITYDSNNATSGSAPIESMKFNSAQTITILGNINLVKNGYIFIGWNTKPDGSGTNYTKGYEYTFSNSNLVLYANWEQNINSQEYTVTYSPNNATSGSVPIDSNKYQSTQNATILDNIDLVKNGFTFIGWNTKLDGTGINYTKDDEYTFSNSNLILYANWEENIIPSEYSITYNSNNATSGSVPVDSNKYKSRQIITILANIDLVRTGFTFKSWNSQSDGLGTNYSPGVDYFFPSSDTVLYAIWEQNRYSLRYNDNGASSGSVPVDYNEYIYRENVTILENIDLVRTGYTFKSWNTQSDGLGTNYSPGVDYFFPSSDTVLYAIWEQNRYTITYNSNGSTSGFSPTDSNKYLKDTVATILDQNSLVKKRFQFLNWNTKVDGTGHNFFPGDKYTVTDKNLTLYPIWKQVEFNITYHGNGTPDDGPHIFGPYSKNNFVDIIGYKKIYDNGDIEISSVLFSNIGYNFIEWNTKPNGTGISYNVEERFIVSDYDLELYAIWDCIPFKHGFYTLDIENNEIIVVDYTNPDHVDTLELPATLFDNPVTHIADRAFEDAKISKFVMHDNITNIGNFAFYNSEISEINLSKNITKISSYMLSGSKISSIEVPEGVTIIESHAFSSNYLLNNVKLPQSLVTIEDFAFFICFSGANLPKTPVLKIPANVTYIGEKFIGSESYNNTPRVYFESLIAPNFHDKAFYAASKGIHDLYCYEGSTGYTEKFWWINVIPKPE